MSVSTGNLLEKHFRMSPSEIRVAFNRAREKHLNDPDRINRAAERHSLRQVTLTRLSIVESSGPRQMVAVPINLSAGGACLMVPVFLYADTRVRFGLQTIDGEGVLATGVVKWCAHVEGRCHDMGIRFDSKVNPADFLAELTTKEDGERVIELNEVVNITDLYERVDVCARMLAKASRAKNDYAELLRIVEQIAEAVDEIGVNKD